MFALKPLSHDSVAGALAKAERYRLLNEPAEAESICHDILEIEPENQQALIMLVLALSDQICDDAQAFSNALAAAAPPAERLRPRLLRRASSGSAAPKPATTTAAAACSTPSTNGWSRRCSSSSRPSICGLRQRRRLAALEHVRAVSRRHPELTARSEEASEPILSE